MSTESVNGVVEAVASTSGSSLMSLLPMVLIFAIFYFFLIRPQKKRQQAIETMVTELQKGDKVIAAGGLYGSIHKIEDNVVYLDIAEGVRVKALKSSVVEVTSDTKLFETTKEEKPTKTVKATKIVKKVTKK